MSTLWAGLCLFFVLGGGDVTARYIRPAGTAFQTECVFVSKKTKTNSSIESTTERGKTRLTVRAEYDSESRLTSARADLVVDGETMTARVAVVKGKARVARTDLPVQEFEVPAGVIVTSAPDWTDTFLLCRQYDRAKGGKQMFAGLWIHPVQPAQRLTFAIERRDATTIERASKKMTLDRYTIHLRGNSAYAAWADRTGKMIKLVPLPYKKGNTNWLVADGFEKSAAALLP